MRPTYLPPAVPSLSGIPSLYMKREILIPIFSHLHPKIGQICPVTRRFWSMIPRIPHHIPTRSHYLRSPLLILEEHTPAMPHRLADMLPRRIVPGSVGYGSVSSF